MVHFLPPVGKGQSSRLWSWLLPAILLCGGCRQEQITVYDVPKESAMAPAVAAMAPEQGVPTQPQIQLGKTPTGWQEQPPGGMSTASFAISGEAGRKGEFSVMAFPGAGVAELDLINIVRQDAGLPALQETEFSRLTEPVAVGTEKGALIDFTGATSSTNTAAPNRVMLATLRHQGITWFFKLAGDSSLLTTQKPVLLDFLKSISFVEGGPLPTQGPHFASTNTKRVNSESVQPMEASSGATPGRPAWEIPSGWQETNATQMLLAKFAVTNQDGEAEVTVSSFPGEVGGLLANVNRWRGQVGLTPLTRDDLDKSVSRLDVLGGTATLVDVSGRAAARGGKETRLVGVVWPRAGQTWFYKLTGDPAAAGREKDAFVKFVQSVRFPNG
jgi:hypothetical protein